MAMNSMPNASSPESSSIEFLILTRIGMIDQLASALADHLLAPLGLPMPEFLMLLHFNYRPAEDKMISQISQERQQLQPGVTKIVQKLVAKKLLRATVNPNDGRSKLFYLTPQGERLYARAVSRLMPALQQAFDGFDAAGKASLFGQLDGLKQWFDTHRPRSEAI